MTQLLLTIQKLLAFKRGVIMVQAEMAGQFMLGARDLEAADGPPSGRDAGQ